MQVDSYGIVSDAAVQGKCSQMLVTMRRGCYADGRMNESDASLTLSTGEMRRIKLFAT